MLFSRTPTSASRVLRALRRYHATRLPARLSALARLFARLSIWLSTMQSTRLSARGRCCWRGRCCCGDLTGAGVAAAAAAGVGAMSDEAAGVVNSRSVIIQIWRAWAN